MIRPEWILEYDSKWASGPMLGSKSLAITIAKDMAKYLNKRLRDVMMRETCQHCGLLSHASISDRPFQREEGQ